MDSWRDELRVDPVPELISSGNEAIKYFTLHDLCDRRDGSRDFTGIVDGKKDPE